MSRSSTGNDPKSDAAVESSLPMDKRPTPIVRDAQRLLVRGIDALERNHIDEAVGLLRQTVELECPVFLRPSGFGYRPHQGA